MLYRRGTVVAPPEQYLSDTGTLPRFLEDGLYHQHLERFFAVFPRKNIALLLHEDIKQAPETAVAAVCRHIGVAARFSDGQVGVRVNDGQAATLPLALRRLLAPVKDIVAPLRTRSLFKAAHAALARPPRYPPLTRDLRLRLRDFYAADVERLARLVGRDVGHWLQVDESVS